MTSDEAAALEVMLERERCARIVAEAVGASTMVGYPDTLLRIAHDRIVQAGRPDASPPMAALKRDHDAMLVNLTATQKRCTELLEEVRQYRKEMGK